MPQSRIAICHRCPHIQKVCRGACACEVDPQRRDIVVITALTIAELPEPCPIRENPDALPPPRSSTVVLPRDEWPPEALDLASRRIPNDRGVGDVMEREFGVPGKLWKWFWKVVGKPCKCTDEQAHLNAKYPFEKQQ